MHFPEGGISFILISHIRCYFVFSPESVHLILPTLRNAISLMVTLHPSEQDKKETHIHAENEGLQIRSGKESPLKAI
jgi:hypothetical protein